MHINWQPNTGILVPSDFDPVYSVQQVLKLFPATQHIALVYNPLTWTKNIAKDFYDINDKFPALRFSMLNPTWTPERLTDAITKFGDNAALMVITSNDHLLLQHVLKGATGIQQVPIFSIFKPNARDQVILGGAVVSAEKLAQLILKLSRHEAVDLAINQWLREVYNYPALEKMGISIDELPADAEVVNRPKFDSDFVYQMVIFFLIIIFLQIGVYLFRERHVKQLLKDRAVEAEAANLAKMRFLSNMSHEVRTPLNGIMGLTSMLLQSAITPQQRQKLTFIEQSSNSLLCILNDILNFSALEKGQTGLNSQVFSVINVVKECVSQLSVSSASKDVPILTYIASDVPTQVIGDEAKLRQVLLNLLANAVKFCEQGKIDIRVTLQQSNASDVVLEFAISDTGIGMSDTQIESVFAAFYQADESNTRQYGGIGMGSAICQKLIHIMEGKLTVQSKVGDGTTVTVHLPFTTHVASELTTNDKISPVASEHKPTAMVVDDNDINRLVTETYLNKLNVNVASAANGKEAVELYRVTPCDIIMMDLQMPVMDGFEATRLIKALNPAVTIIAISASTEQDTINKAIEAGADDFIAKPATFDTIADRLTPYLCKR